MDDDNRDLKMFFNLIQIHWYLRDPNGDDLGQDDAAKEWIDDENITTL